MGRADGRWWVRSLAKAAVCLWISVCAAMLGVADGAAAQAARPVPGGTLTVAVEEDPKGFDAIAAGYLTASARSAAMAVEERLFEMDGQGKLIPQLGLTATSSKDGKSWIIKLRKGIVYHDGTPFNADAVVGHWQRLLEPGNRFFGRAAIQPIASVTRVDDFTVRFDLRHPWLPFRDVIASPVLMAAYIPSPKAVKDKTQDRMPVGTGPYRFKEWLPNDRLVVIKNASYWQQGKPYLDRIVFRTVPDMQTRFAGLKSGELDVILTDRGANVLQAKEDRSLRVFSSEATGAETFLLNTSKPPLDDVRVRRALAYAWNQDFYIKASYKDTISVARDPFGGTLSCGDLGYLEYDPAKGRRLIAEYGKPVNLELQITNTARGREFGDLLQRMLKEIGVGVSIKPLTLGQRNKLVFAGDYQMTGWHLFDSTDMAPVLYSNLFSASTLNFSRYKNPKLDKFLETAQMSTSPKERQHALCGAAREINREAVFLYRGGLRYNAIAKADVQGISRVDAGIVRVKEAWLSGGKR